MNCNMNQESYLPIPNNFPLYPVDTGYALGNLYQGLYNPYQGFTNYPLNPKTQKESALYQLLAYQFGMDELKLYLDLHPNHMQLINLYRQYDQQYKMLKDQYTSMYGPILAMDNTSNQWQWSKSPWPWENQTREGD